MARDVLDSIRYVVLGTIDEDGRTRTSPVYFTPHGYEDLYWVSHPDTHHSHNLARDDRLERRGLRLDAGARPDPGGLRDRHGAGDPGRTSSRSTCRAAFDPEGRGGRRVQPARSSPGDALRLWVLHVDSWEVHVGAGHPHPRHRPGPPGGRRSRRV